MMVKSSTLKLFYMSINVIPYVVKVNISPIKSPGIKTKLVPWIASIIPSNFKGLWIEPFMGTGVVAFNIAPKCALLCDIPPNY